MKKVIILGSTGSIGTNTLDIIENHPGKYKVVSLAANRNIETIIGQAKKFKPEYIAVFDESRVDEIKERLSGSGIDVQGGVEAVLQAARMDADIVVAAISGSAGLLPTYEAIKLGRKIALANKETLVMGGDLILKAARQSGSEILPVDSEHSALFQSLQAGKRSEVRRLILTASGGPFYNYSRDELEKVKPKNALKHPVWDMGAKITIDSASMANKGLEVIEAVRLFDIDPSNVEVVIHPQSFIHSMVEFKDTSIIAQMGAPDMRTPIQYALTYPERDEGVIPPFSFKEQFDMKFLPPKDDLFPALKLAYNALNIGQSGSIIYNAGDEAAVDSFLAGGLKFTDIPVVIETLLNEFSAAEPGSIDDIIIIDEEAKRRSYDIIRKISE